MTQVLVRTSWRSCSQQQRRRHSASANCSQRYLTSIRPTAGPSKSTYSPAVQAKHKQRGANKVSASDLLPEQNNLWQGRFGATSERRKIVVQLNSDRNPSTSSYRCSTGLLSDDDHFSDAKAPRMPQASQSPVKLQGQHNRRATVQEPIQQQREDQRVVRRRRSPLGVQPSAVHLSSPSTRKHGDQEAMNDRQTFKGLVVVEGIHDARAVEAAVDTKVWYLAGVGRVISDKRVELLRHAIKGAGTSMPVVALMDPDTAGRQGRVFLDGIFGARLSHAFIPAQDAVAAKDGRLHEEGNLGVEHAHPRAIIAALKSARLPKDDRSVFTRKGLETLGLVTEMTSRANAEQRCAPAMRMAVGRLLGIGQCNAKQLLHQLNRFGFEPAEVEAAVVSSRLTIFNDETRSESIKHQV